MLWLAGLMGNASNGAASLAMDRDRRAQQGTVVKADDVVRAGHTLLTQVNGTKNTATQRKDLLDRVAKEIGGDARSGHAPHKDCEANWSKSQADLARRPQNLTCAEEQVLVGDWIANGPVSEVIDYQASSESLVLVWDDLTPIAQEPLVSVVPDPDDDEIMHVMMNDKSVATVYGDPELTVSDVTLIPLSSALIVGLKPV